ncbi:MAG: PQQ-binding-like beta-propeller repeat protein [Pyrinomonadaceae bacterium]|nr:PQQ-binding-like beta-propeller repeat protein [Pyrinomonadaceae bacterium]
MRTILFGNPQKDNLLDLRTLVSTIFAGFLLAMLPVWGFGQTDWASPLKKCWEFSSPEMTRFSPASDNAYIFISTSKGSILAINQSSGAIEWTADLGGNFRTDLDVINGRLFATAIFDSRGSNSTVIRKVNSLTGVPFWRYSGDEDRLTYLSADKEQNIYLADPRGVIISLTKLGEVRWKSVFETGITTPLRYHGPQILVGTSSNSLIVIDRETGRISSQVNLSRTPSSLRVSDEGRIFVGDERGEVYGYTAEFSRIWKAKTGAGVTQIDVFRGDPIVISKDNFVYRISAASGKKLWKRKLAGRIFGGVMVDSMHQVFLTSGASTAIILNLTNGNLINKIDFDAPFVSAPIRTQTGFAVPTETGIASVAAGNCKN